MRSVIPVLAIILIWSVLRFVNLEQSPPGFYVDEAAISAQVICIRQSGHDMHFKKLPIFSEVLGGGYATPVTLYGGALWTALFGDSIVSFRSFAAFFGLLTLIGVFWLASELFDSRLTGTMAALCLAISPWAFQFSRIAWDPPLAPAFLILGIAALFWFTDKIYRRSILAGVFFALAAYSYPPVRLQLMIALPACGVLIYKREPSRFLKIILVTIITSVIISFPLIWLTLTGEIQGRFQMLSIFNPNYLNQNGGISITNILGTFVKNVFKHFSFDYLFLTGDANLRHSTQWVGLLSWIDILAILILMFFLLRKRVDGVIKYWRELLLIVFIFMAGIVPAAVTWESLPHSLRSIGSAPFLAVFSGFLISEMVRKYRRSMALVAAVALIFSGYFGYGYFIRYPLISSDWFDASAVQLATELTIDSKTSENQIRDRINKDYPELALSYFLLSSKIISCSKQ